MEPNLKGPQRRAWNRAHRLERVVPRTTEVLEQMVAELDLAVGPHGESLVGPLRALGKQYISEGDIEAAVPVLTRLADMGHGDVEVFRWLSLATETADLETAIVWQKQVAEASQDPDEMARLGLMMMRKGDIGGDAVEVLERAVSLFDARRVTTDKKFLAHVALGDWWTKSDPRRARANYEGALLAGAATWSSEAPELVPALTGLALLYRRTSFPAKSLPIYAQILVIQEAQLGPNHPGLAPVLRAWASAMDESNQDGGNALRKRARGLGQELLLER
jgi:hypothetical protein